MIHTITPEAEPVEPIKTANDFLDRIHRSDFVMPLPQVAQIPLKLKKQSEAQLFREGRMSATARR